MRRHPGTFAAGLVFMAIGAVYVLQGLGLWDVRPGRVWPIALIVIGAVILLTARSTSTVAEAPTEADDDPYAEGDDQPS